MQCEKFEMLWNEALDERRAPEDDARLVAHAAECRPCAEMLRLTDVLLTGVEARPAIEPPADLPQRVLAELNRPASRFRPAGWAVAALAVAAAIAVVIDLSWQTDSLRSQPVEGLETGSQVAIQPAPPQPIDPWERGLRDTPLQQLGPALDSLPDFQDEYLSVLRQTGTAVALLPGQVRRATLSTEPGLVADHLRPVAEPMTAAFNALRRTLPGSASEMPGLPDDAKSSSYPGSLKSMSAQFAETEERPISLEITKRSA
jgi:hypothetical protein